MLRGLLQQERKKQGITQAEMGKRLSQTQSFISKVERGARELNPVEFVDFCAALRVDPCKLLTQIPIPSRLGRKLSHR